MLTWEQVEQTLVSYETDPDAALVVDAVQPLGENVGRALATVERVASAAVGAV